MTQQVSYVKGETFLMDYTPGSAVACGDVVVVGNLPTICQNPQGIASGALGAMALRGGIYRGTADAAIAIGKKVFWNDSANKLTESATGNRRIGNTVSASAADGDPILFEHAPDGAPAA